MNTYITELLHCATETNTILSINCVFSCSVMSGSRACQAPLTTEFSKQEYWSRFSFPTPGDLSNPRIKPRSPEAPALAGRLLPTEVPGKPF